MFGFRKSLDSTKTSVIVTFLIVIAFIFLSCSDILNYSARQAADARAVATGVPHIPRLTGVNWFGFETGNYVVHGLWARDYKSMLKQMKDLGFNCVRIPWANEMLDKYPASIQVNAWGMDPYTKTQGLNVDLAGLSSIQVLDKIIEEAGRLGLRIILDNHSRKADGYMQETLWYTSDFTEDEWISDWLFMVERYKNSPQVAAVDINNEPHGGLLGMGMKPPASWGYDVTGYGITDWRKAAIRCAKAILNVNPDIIIVMQGVQEYGAYNYWWGSNHMGLKDYPVTEIPSDHLMFSVHEYGPEVAPQDWFTDPNFPDNLPDVWRRYFWFIYEQQIAGLYIGEMGIKESSAADPSSVPYKWFTSFLKFAGDKVHWTYWAWNPNSGDTGGILKDDWLTINPVKYNLIKPYLAALTPSPSPTLTPSPTPTPTPTISFSPSPTPTPTPTVSSTPSPTPTPTSTPPAGTCDNPEAGSIPLVYDGAGEYCWTLTTAPAYINSWNLNVLTINGVDLTNKWVAGSGLPARIDGLYYIHYQGNFTWSHFEAK